MKFTAALCLLLAPLVAATEPSLRGADNDERELTFCKYGTIKPVTIDFNKYYAGPAPTDLGYGVSVVGYRRNCKGTLLTGKNRATIFDTKYPTGNDGDDLGLATELKKVLIIQEKGVEGPDDNACGGLLEFTFDKETIVKGFKILDFEEYGSEVSGNTYSGEFNKHLPTTGNGEFKFVCLKKDYYGNCVGKKNVKDMAIDLAGSGAIDNLTLKVCVPY